MRSYELVSHLQGLFWTWASQVSQNDRQMPWRVQSVRCMLCVTLVQQLLDVIATLKDAEALESKLGIRGVEITLGSCSTPSIISIVNSMSPRKWQVAIADPKTSEFYKHNSQKCKQEP